MNKMANSIPAMRHTVHRIKPTDYSNNQIARKLRVHLYNVIQEKLQAKMNPIKLFQS
jgi:hypothetical protein